MVNIRTAKHLLSLIFLCLCMQAPAQAQQVAVEILDDVSVTKSDFNAVVKILFKRPVRYISHNPSSRAKTLNINIELLKSFQHSRLTPESESFPLNPDTGITEVAFEALSTNNHFLIIYFNKEVSFEIIQGNDHRSLSIVMYGID